MVEARSRLSPSEMSWARSCQRVRPTLGAGPIALMTGAGIRSGTASSLERSLLSTVRERP